MYPSRFGRYTVVRKIASGGMATVYLCRYLGEEGFRKKVAVKAIREDLSSDLRFRELFAREARLAASLSHPNLVQVFDFGREGDHYFLAMEYVEGWNLAQAIAQARQKILCVPLGVFRHWILGILAAVGYLHRRGVVHRDISPSNVLLSRDGAVKVADFGIAAAARSTLPRGGGIAGKAAYLAPEAARGGAWTPASDLFAVAVVAAEMFLPRPMFEGSSREETVGRILAHDEKEQDLKAVPEAVRSILRKGLAAEPSRRFAVAADFAGAILEAVPASGGTKEIKEYWDALFPLGVEEETALDLNGRGGGEGPAAIRERRGSYGARTVWIAAKGIALLVAAGAGGFYLLRDGAPGRAKPAQSPAVPQPVLPPAAGGDLLGAGGRRGGRAVQEKEPGGVLAPRPTARPGAVEYAARSSSRTGEPVAKVLGPRNAAQGAGPAAGESAGDGVRDASPGPAMIREPLSNPPLAVLKTNPPGAYVLLEDGTRIGRTPLTIDARAWRGRKVAVEMEGYERKTFPGDLLAGGTHLRLEMERQLGIVEAIQAIPWAKVYESGRYLGKTPLYSVRLPAGERRLRFVNEPLGVDRTETLLVRPGANPKMIVELTAGGSLTACHLERRASWE